MVLRNYTTMNKRQISQTLHRSDLTRDFEFELSPVIDAFPSSILRVTTSPEYHEIAG